MSVCRLLPQEKLGAVRKGQPDLPLEAMSFTMRLPRNSSTWPVRRRRDLVGRGARVKQFVTHRSSLSVVCTVKPSNCGFRCNFRPLIHSRSASKWMPAMTFQVKSGWRATADSRLRDVRPVLLPLKYALRMALVVASERLPRRICPLTRPGDPEAVFTIRLVERRGRETPWYNPVSRVPLRMVPPVTR